MVTILGKLVRKQPAARIITTFKSPIPTPPLLTNLSETRNPPLLPISFLGPKTEGSNPSHYLQFYPIFSFGCFLNPIPSTGFIQSEAEDIAVVNGDSHKIWADSVKKKRKRKMNKQKLKKLRKRLRRKT